MVRSQANPFRGILDKLLNGVEKQNSYHISSLINVNNKRTGNIKPDSLKVVKSNTQLEEHKKAFKAVHLIGCTPTFSRKLKHQDHF